MFTYYKLFKCKFLHSCAAVNKISTGLECRAVPLLLAARCLLRCPVSGVAEGQPVRFIAPLHCQFLPRLHMESFVSHTPLPLLC